MCCKVDDDVTDFEGCNSSKTQKSNYLDYETLFV